MSMIRRPVPRTSLSLPELGFGAASVGNLYAPVSGAEAAGALAAAFDAGMTFVDTAPHYGHGLSERRVGDAVRSRSDVVVSTKVGRLLVPDHALEGRDEMREGFRSPLPFARRFDYSRDGILRSFEDSLQRLGLSRVDMLLVHDIGRVTHGTDHTRTFAELTEGGGLDALAELRAADVIGAIGLGVNEWQICLEVMDHADLDLILLAGRYTLLEQAALDRFLPRCIERATAVAIGGAYNSGILATGTRTDGMLRYNYDRAPPEVIDRVRRIEAICDDQGVPIAAAALQFPLAHPAVASVVVGLRSAAEVGRTLDLYRHPIPASLWSALQDAGLLRPDAPLPTGAAERA